MWAKGNVLFLLLRISINATSGLNIIFSIGNAIFCRIKAAFGWMVLSPVLLCASTVAAIARCALQY